MKASTLIILVAIGLLAWYFFQRYQKSTAGQSPLGIVTAPGANTITIKPALIPGTSAVTSTPVNTSLMAGWCAYKPEQQALITEYNALPPDMTMYGMGSNRKAVIKSILTSVCPAALMQLNPDTIN